MKFKHIISILLSLTVFVGIQTQAFATGNNMDITYTEEITYTATIPQYVNAQKTGEDINTSAYTVKAQDIVIPEDRILTATVEYSGMLSEGNAEIPYKLVSEDGDIESGDNIIVCDAGQPNTEVCFNFGAAITEKAKYAGQYYDTATFTFKLGNKAYTADEIEADEHLYGIGKTKTEYVVAKFDDDYSTVEIFKNGLDSDGIMKDFQELSGSYDISTGFSSDAFAMASGEVSPMSKHGFELQTAIIEDGVVNIGAGAFLPFNYNKFMSGEMDVLEDLEDSDIGIHYVSIPNSVTSIGDYAFFYNIALGSNDTSTSITPITIPVGVKNIGKYAFSLGDHRYGLVMNFNEGLEEIGEGAFYNISFVKTANSTITSLKDTDENLKLPTTIRLIDKIAFANTEVSGSVIISGAVGDGAFTGSDSLEAVTIGGNVGIQAFSGRENLKSVTLLDGVETIGDEAFCGPKYSLEDNNKLTKLEFVSLPNTLIRIGDSAFKGNRIRYLYIPGSVTTIGENAFDRGYTNGKSTIYTVGGIENSVAQIWANENKVEFVVPYVNEEGIVFNKDKTEIVSYPVTETNAEYVIPDSVKRIAPGAFERCTSLQSIIIPDSVTSIGEHAFFGCSQLQSLTIPGSVETIDNCILGSWSAGKERYYIESLKEVVISDGVKVLSKKSTAQTNTAFDDAVFNFVGASSLTKIVIPNSVNSISIYSMPKSVIVYGSGGSAAEIWANKNNYSFNTQ